MVYIFKGAEMAVRRIVVEVVGRVSAVTHSSLAVNLSICRYLTEVLDHVQLTEWAAELDANFWIFQIGILAEQVVLGSLANWLGATKVSER